MPFGFTLFLILTEAFLSILFPLFIGQAIDDTLANGNQGIINLGILCLILLIVGTGRRVFDSRYYAKRYQEIGTKVSLKSKDQDISTKSARLTMLKEFVEFLEFSLPELINALIALLGSIIIIAKLNLSVFAGTVLTTILVMTIYLFSSKKTMRYNKNSNDEFENQVKTLATHDQHKMRIHLKKLMFWNVKLSDLEALNYSLVWILLTGLLLVSLNISVNNDFIQYGAIFSLVMYVFQYMEGISQVPFYYQNWLRLKEMSYRLFEY